MTTIKMFWTMFIGLFQRKKFEDREDFLEWYWDEQIPDKRYPNESLYEAWETFKWYSTLGGLRADIASWYRRHFGKRQYGYSYTFGKDGYYTKCKQGWVLFTPNDNSFTEGVVCTMTEYKNGNPLFQ